MLDLVSHYYHRQFLTSVLPFVLPGVISSTLFNGFGGKPVVYDCPVSCTILYSGDISPCYQRVTDRELAFVKVTTLTGLQKAPCLDRREWLRCALAILLSTADTC